MMMDILTYACLYHSEKEGLVVKLHVMIGILTYACLYHKAMMQLV